MRSRRAAILVMIWALLVPVAVYGQNQSTANGTYSVAAVQGDCAAGENCYRLRIRCTADPNNIAIPLRFRAPAAGRTEFSDVVIRESGISPASQPAGGVVFFTGSYGDFFYSNGNAPDVGPADLTLSIIGTQYTAFEIKWLNADPSELSTVSPPGNPLGAVNQAQNPGIGYVSGSEGYGSLADKCGVREALEWISTNRTPRGDQKLCATGNSGGGAQIGYALTVYGGADYLKSAVITAGPPYTKIFNACFDPMYNNGLNAQGFPDGTVPSFTLGLGGAGGGRRQLEEALGWPTNTCARLNSFSLDPAKKLFAQRTSLAAVDENGLALEFRDFAARDKSNVLTSQFFVRSSMDDGGAQIQGDAYLAQLSAAGGLLPGGVDDVVAANGGSPPDYLQHTTHDTPSGAAKIRNFLMSNNNCTYAAAPTPFSFLNLGGFSLQSSGKSTSPVTVGYGRIQPNAGSASPSGLAIFEFRQGSTLVSEAGVPATPLIRSGRIYAEINGSVNTGVAIANPNAQATAISFYFTDQTGNIGSGSMVVPAGGQISAFLNQPPFNGRAPLTGTLTFDSSVPVAVIALRGLTNERQEYLLTTLPVTDLAVAASTGTVVFPHFADGAGWSTRLVLVNPTDNTLTGSVQFLDAAGLAAAVNIGGQVGSTFGYTIPARSSQNLQTLGLSASLLAGSVRVVPVANGVAPTGVAVFSLRNSAVTVAEAGVPAVAPAAAFRVYAEASGSPGAIGSIQTGLAVSNLSANTATVTLELTTLSGASTGLTGTLTIPPNGQQSDFLNQIPGLSSMPLPFRGVLRVASASSISMVALRGRYNERGDFLITTIPPVNESAPPSNSSLYFPHIADSGGYTTQFILFSGSASQPSGGSLSFFKQSGSDWTLSLR